jgi:hypothetical protein
MSKIYICWHCNYDESYVEAIFDEKNKHLADKWIKRMKDREQGKRIVEEYEVNEKIDFINRDKLIFWVGMFENGDIERCEVEFCAFKSIAKFDYDYEEGHWVREQADNKSYKFNDDSYNKKYVKEIALEMYVWADDMKEAIQIVDNKRKELIANNLWGVNNGF